MIAIHLSLLKILRKLSLSVLGKFDFDCDVLKIVANVATCLADDCDVIGNNEKPEIAYDSSNKHVSKKGVLFPKQFHVTKYFFYVPLYTAHTHG